MASIIDIERKISSRACVINASAISDPSAEISIVVPTFDGGKTVTVQAQADRTGTALADAIESLVTPITRENNTLVYHGDAKEESTMSGVTNSSYERTITIPLAENRPAGLSALGAAFASRFV